MEVAEERSPNMTDSSEGEVEQILYGADYWLLIIEIHSCYWEKEDLEEHIPHDDNYNSIIKINQN